MASKRAKCVQCLHQNLMLILTIASILVGIAVGAIMRTFNAPRVATLYVGLLGELFMRALNFSVLPLLACNIIAVTAKMNPSKEGIVALFALSYCVFMNLMGSLCGLVATVIIQPGNPRDSVMNVSSTTSGVQSEHDLIDVFPDFLRNAVPDNIIKTLLYSTVTYYVPTDSGENATIYKRTLGTSESPNILGILTTSLVLGLIVGSRGDKARPIIALTEAVADVMIVLIEKIVRLLPLAMLSLIASAVSQLASVEEGLISLALFVATAATYLTVLALVILPFFFFVTTRSNLFRIYKAIGAPVLTAFSLASSLIALPDLYKSCDKLGMRPGLVRTIAPFLTSFNANGSSAFITSAVLFTAQFSGHQLNAGQLVVIALLSAINVMALPAVPSASLITVFLIMRVFGVPETGLSMLFVVEFVVDRMRTVLNVLSHGTCVAFVNTKTDSENDKPIAIVEQPDGLLSSADNQLANLEGSNSI